MQFEKSSPDMITYFEAIAPNGDDVVQRKMFGYPCCFINGNMFTGLHGNSLIIRLEASDRAEFLQQPGTSLFEPMPGRPMKEYVVPTAQMLKDKATITAWINRSAAYARSLPPKLKRPKS